MASIGNAIFGKTLTRVVLAGALGAATLAGSVPAEARGWNRGGDGAAVAVGAGILGLAVGAAIASDRPAYYGGGYYAPAYYPPYPAYGYYAYPRYYPTYYRGYRGYQAYRGYPAYRGGYPGYRGGYQGYRGGHDGYRGYYGRR
jgi:hypothetical protein